MGSDPGTTASDQRAAAGRVLLVSASIGSGHDRAAQELARRLNAAGFCTTSVDVLTLGRGEGARMRSTYAWLLSHLPWVYDLAMRFWALWPKPLEHFVAARSGSVEADLERLINYQPLDLVVSLYSLSSQCLGRLRASGRLQTPVLTWVLDPGAHPYWVHPGVDRHLTVLHATARALRRFGARDVEVTRPLVRPEFDVPADAVAARERLGLPSGPIAVLTAGSWACGRVLHAVDLLAGSAVVPVVLCARDDALRDQVAKRVGAVALGWIDDMAGLLAACDVVVDNAGGLTFWEALTVGRPVVLFDVLAGHGRLNAQTLDDCGAAIWVRRSSRLASTVAALATDRARAAGQVARARGLLPKNASHPVVDALRGRP